jgi:peptide/nickel transport system permease protein
MKATRVIAAAVLALLYLAAFTAELAAPRGYAAQARDRVNYPPSAEFPLGADALGRDMLARILHGTRISLLLAPAAAIVSTALAGLVGGVAGYAGGAAAAWAGRSVDAFLGVPWLLLLITVRAALPLDVEPFHSVTITFLLLGLLGWAAPARVALAAAGRLRTQEFMLQARACGCSRLALLRAHFLPALRPVLIAQFWTAAPLYILAEANLGFLGLGVGEPLPSWGNLLRGLEQFHSVAANPWLLLPLGLLLAAAASFHVLIPRENLHS